MQISWCDRAFPYLKTAYQHFSMSLDDKDMHAYWCHRAFFYLKTAYQYIMMQDVKMIPMSVSRCQFAFSYLKQLIRTTTCPNCIAMPVSWFFHVFPILKS